MRLPDPRELVNTAGRFLLTVERDGSRIRLERTLEIAGGRVEAQGWGALRGLLLEDCDPANTVIFGR
ncbi:MAG: hypothetical protein IPI34_15300 [bacterium]|nr:hypothetical protein [bacterium]